MGNITLPRIEAKNHSEDEFSNDELLLLKEDWMTSEMGNIFEDDAISLPSEDSLYHLDEYFKLRTINPTRRHS